MLRRPDARAAIAGSDLYPQLGGTVRFYQTDAGVLTAAHIHGLPRGRGSCGGRFFGFHIHSGDSCRGRGSDAFAGGAFQVSLTDRFRVRDIIGRTVVIHAEADDFRTQPGGDSGDRIACGPIRAPGRR